VNVGLATATPAVSFRTIDPWAATVVVYLGERR
jgi:hypothetical protein